MKEMNRRILLASCIILVVAGAYFFIAKKAYQRGHRRAELEAQYLDAFWGIRTIELLKQGDTAKATKLYRVIVWNSIEGINELKTDLPPDGEHAEEVDRLLRRTADYFAEHPREDQADSESQAILNRYTATED